MLESCAVHNLVLDGWAWWAVRWQAAEASGTYAFIPDALIVGTTFVNTVANVLSTYSHNATMHLTPRGGTQFADSIPGELPVTSESWGKVVQLGPLCAGPLAGGQQAYA